ncbi:hypothetical protein [Bradyrhizobium sp. Leo121]|uniref:hypothetical protein n=1 Tax=Bradyrhizobium sp. Leo121 TaxID=1571195 RepID=UPI0010291F8F|nr:hypothetical protein [Bradyrhizobium sp. Leo121]
MTDRFGSYATRLSCRTIRARLFRQNASVVLLLIPVKKGLPEIGATMDLEPDTMGLIVNLTALIVFVSFILRVRWKKQSD